MFQSNALIWPEIRYGELVLSIDNNTPWLMLLFMYSFYALKHNFVILYGQAIGFCKRGDLKCLLGLFWGQVARYIILAVIVRPLRVL